jgi:hypothetical protein
MHRRSHAAVRQEVKRLQRRSTEQLLVSLSRQAVRSNRQNTIVYRSAKSGGYSGRGGDSDQKEIRIYTKRSKGDRFSKPLSEAATIDLSMLRGLRSALHGEVSVDNGEEVFNGLWRRVQKRVCDEWDLCDKIKRADGGLVWKLIDFLQKGAAPSERQIIAAVVILAFRMGPHWMCNCGGND